MSEPDADVVRRIWLLEARLGLIEQSLYARRVPQPAGVGERLTLVEARLAAIEEQLAAILRIVSAVAVGKP